MTNESNTGGDTTPEANTSNNGGGANGNRNGKNVPSRHKTPKRPKVKFNGRLPK